MDYNSKLSFVRSSAKKLNLVFLVDHSVTINSKVAYKFVDRVSRSVVASNYTLDSAFEECYLNNCLNLVGKI